MKSQPKKIVLISSGQPSLNPRLVKEADALVAEGYSVAVLYSYWNHPGMVADERLCASKKWTATCVGGSPASHRISYLLSKLIHKSALWAARKIGMPLFADLAISRNTYHLTEKAKQQIADLYIAHNLGALPAAVKSAKFHKKSCGFDAEDFHRHEVSNDPDNFEVCLKAFVEQRYIPQTDYITASSPEIAAAYQQLFPAKIPVMIRNVFSTPDQLPQKTERPMAPLKLFWFSQTIGRSRGIENLIEVLNRLNRGEFELHLLGAPQTGLRKMYFEALANQERYTLHFHDFIAPEDLIPFSSQFDIGLALEPAFSINNDMALSNKIFTYLQAGLAIIASDTTAQGNFMRQYPGMGQVYSKNDLNSLQRILNSYASDRQLLYKHQQRATQYARETLNWEAEKMKFLEVVKNTFKHAQH